MKLSLARIVTATLFILLYNVSIIASPTDNAAMTSPTAADTAAATYVEGGDEAAIDELDDLGELATETPSFHKVLKTKFIEGDASFMSVIALVLVIGLAICIERIIYLTLSEIDARRFMHDLGEKIGNMDIDGAAAQCEGERGPVAMICREGVKRIDDRLENIERAISSYGSFQAANLEKGCSWITMFIVMAPSLGFLGTVVGIVMAFQQIQIAGDISPTIVAGGMQVALITTIFGIIVALILQLFYNYILSKIDRITSQMEVSAIELLDIIAQYKDKK